MFTSNEICKISNHKKLMAKFRFFCIFLVVCSCHSFHANCSTQKVAKQMIDSFLHSIQSYHNLERFPRFSGRPKKTNRFTVLYVLYYCRNFVCSSRKFLKCSSNYCTTYFGTLRDKVRATRSQWSVSQASYYLYSNSAYCMRKYCIIVSTE